MKGAIAAFVAAAAEHLEQGAPHGSISLLITGDEEGAAVDGTVRVLEWMAANGQVPDFCLVGEPTNPGHLGRSRSRSAGAAASTPASPCAARRVMSPIRIAPTIRCIGCCARSRPSSPSRWTPAPTWFEPSSVQITSIDVGNPATNVIPAEARAALNVRFNDLHSGASLEAWLRAVIARHAERFDLEVAISGEAFLTRPGAAVETLRRRSRPDGEAPRLDTGGGTSDARFIARYCPVAEFGLVGRDHAPGGRAGPVGRVAAVGAHLPGGDRRLPAVNGRSPPGSRCAECPARRRPFGLRPGRRADPIWRYAASLPRQPGAARRFSAGGRRPGARARRRALPL